MGGCPLKHVLSGTWTNRGPWVQLLKVTRRPREGPAHERCQHRQMAGRPGSLGAPSLPSSCILSSQLWLAPQFVLVTACLFSGPISRAFHSRRCSVPSPRCPDTSSGLGILPLSSLPRGHVHRSCSLLSCALEPGGVGWGKRGVPSDGLSWGSTGQSKEVRSVYTVDGVGQ